MISSDAPRRILEIPIISLTCVDCRPGKALRGVSSPKLQPVEILFKGVRRFVACNPYPVRLLQRTPYRLG